MQEDAAEGGDMSIDWNAFNPWSSLAGGILIGLAAALLILLNGRVAGVSGILGGLLPPKPGDAAWRVLFLLGMVLAPLVYAAFARLPVLHIEAGGGLLVAAGLLVGIGTRYGSGCTSGHGVCGVARLSPRSVVATLAFMLVGFLTVFLLRHAFP
ncbi:YeeE/YedE family protein [Massilia niabensis]|uniref:YeeE/YedE family protein n=1 Tax=Massilia niabensis TaxID=544910 RepID=A0ABW0LBE5_9BURK